MVCALFDQSEDIRSDLERLSLENEFNPLTLSMLAILTTHPIQYQVPLWQALAKEGSVPFEVWYLTDYGMQPSYDRQFGKRFSWDIDVLFGYPYRILPNHETNRLNGFAKTRIDKSFTELLKERKVRVLWVQGWSNLAYWQAVWKAHAEGLDVWLRGESHDLAITPTWKKPLKKLLIGEFFKRVDQFLCIGSANKRLYESYGVDQERLNSAPYCVDNERFIGQSDELSKQRNAIRHSWNIADNAFCILFAGKFMPLKRPFDLVEAVKKVNGKHAGRPIHLLFAGSGECGREIRQSCHVVYDADSDSYGEVNTLGRNNVLPLASFAGFLNQTEIPKAYAAADCLVLPSERETWGLVVNEALASGLPCIVSDTCGCAEDLVSPIRPALRTPLGDIDAISAALVSLMQKPIPTSVLRAQVANFDLRKSLETVRSLYHSA